MPTYEYLCQTCSHRFETWQKMTDEPLTICPECGGHIRRVLYATGVIFKGPGFYVTDHKNDHAAGSKNGAKKEEGAAETPKSTTEESKPSANGAGASGAKASESTATSAA